MVLGIRVGGFCCDDYDEAPEHSPRGSSFCRRLAPGAPAGTTRLLGADSGGTAPSRGLDTGNTRRTGCPQARERGENLGLRPDEARAAASEALREGKDQRHEMMQCLRREAVWRKVAPHTPRARWLRGLNLKTDLDKWIHTERLRGAAYPGRSER